MFGKDENQQDGWPDFIQKQIDDFINENEEYWHDEAMSHRQENIDAFIAENEKSWKDDYIKFRSEEIEQFIDDNRAGWADDCRDLEDSDPDD